MRFKFWLVTNWYSPSGWLRTAGSWRQKYQIGRQAACAVEGKNNEAFHHEKGRPMMSSGPVVDFVVVAATKRNAVMTLVLAPAPWIKSSYIYTSTHIKLGTQFVWNSSSNTHCDCWWWLWRCDFTVCRLIFQMITTMCKRSRNPRKWGIYG